MGHEAEQRSIGPIERYVIDKWDEIKAAVHDGLSVSYQLADLDAYLDEKSDEIRQRPQNHPARVDYSRAVFINEWKRENDLKYTIESRNFELKLNNDFGNRLINLSEDLAKFAVKTSFLAHGAIGLALIAAIFQNPSPEIISFIRYMLWFSLAGAACSVASIAAMYYSYGFFGRKFIGMSVSYVSKSQIDDLHKKQRRWSRGLFFITDFPIILSALIIFFQLVAGLMKLPSLVVAL